MKRKEDTVASRVKSKVALFYSDDRISSERPEKRFKNKRLMSMSLAAAFYLFRKENPGCKVGKTMFK